MKSYYANHLKLDRFEKKLYKIALLLPIFDYHCHLDPSKICGNGNQSSIYDAWIKGDDYKYRAMRALGVDEEYITGNKTDEEKCIKFLSIVPKLIGNPLYEWVYLELERVFEIKVEITEENVESIYQKMKTKLSTITPLDVLKKFHVHTLCTTDDILSDLEYHQKLHQSKYPINVLPSFRPDPFISFEDDKVLENIQKLSNKCNHPICSIEDYLECLDMRLQYFKENKAIVTDHGFDRFIFMKSDKDTITILFDKLLKGENLSLDERYLIKSYVLVSLGKMYNKYDMVMQLHIGAIRENNTRIHEQIGFDMGCDSVNDEDYMHALSSFLDELEKVDMLPKIIVYNLDGTKNMALATMVGNFQNGRIKGKLQFGPSWWYNDHYDGITNQIRTMANNGVLSTSVGFLSDASTVFSYVRHDYYRRVLCKVIASYVRNGQYHNNFKNLETIITDICFNNAYNYFMNKGN
ncbi:MAG: glucuronate isomerase [Bacilli bacterium]